MKVGSLFSYKLKRGLAGRRQSCERVKAKISQEDKVIWMHAASLGEYEQGLPVLEQLKIKFPEHKILVTFFSPSGYENVVKKTTIADVVCYLPFDLPKFINEFTSHFRTDIFITVKYDFWYNLLRGLKAQCAKTYVVSALFYETQIYFKPYGKWFVNELAKNVDWFFHQTIQSSALAKSIGLESSSTSGDTRFDRVKKIRERDNSVDFIEDFKENKKLIVFGSSWEAEERIAEMVARKSPKTKIIIAPHDLKRISHLKAIFPNAVLYSELQHLDFKIQNSNILIIDCIGLLSKIYSYADIAVVGGGFHGKGLHNILEAATFGMPVIFGNHYHKNPEADALIAAHGGKSFEDEFFAAPYILGLLTNVDLLPEMTENARNFVQNQPIATEIVLRKILSDNLNTRTQEFHNN